MSFEAPHLYQQNSNIATNKTGDNTIFSINLV